MSSLRKIIASLLLATLLFLSACTSAPPSRFDQAQKESTARGVKSVVKESESGGSFNKFFPGDTGGYKRVYTQEKKGFAEAKLEKDGKTVAMMSISDTLNNMAATAKFKQSSQNIQGYPAVAQGSTGTAVLVNDRYQVKILSRDPSFTEDKRQDWLAKFDLRGLEKLK